MHNKQIQYPQNTESIIYYITFMTKSVRVVGGVCTLWKEKDYDKTSFHVYCTNKMQLNYNDKAPWWQK